MAVYKHETTRRHESETCPGVVFYLNKMTEGRRLTLRAKIAEPNRRVREILKEQAMIEKQDDLLRDTNRWLELQDQFDAIMLEVINPAWVLWGVKKVEGLEADGKPLGLEDYLEWPSNLFDEILRKVKDESELNGAERKNFESPTTSGEPAEQSQSPLTVQLVDVKATGATETVDSTILVG